MLQLVVGGCALALDWSVMFPVLSCARAALRFLWAWAQMPPPVETVPCPRCDGAVRLQLDFNARTAAIIERGCGCALTVADLAAMGDEAYEQWRESRIW